MPECRRYRKKNQAMSLAEVIVGFLLFAIVIIPTFGIIPTAYMCIKKAEDYATASCYAQEVLEIYSISDPSMTPDEFHRTWDTILNNTEYHVTMDVYALDERSPHSLLDVVINMYWKKIPEKVQVFRRVYYNE